MNVKTQKGIRRIIEGYATGRRKRPVYLGEGSIYIVPSDSELGAYYVVGLLKAGVGKPYIKVDNCKGFRFNINDHCKHTEEAEGLFLKKVRQALRGRKKKR